MADSREELKNRGEEIRSRLGLSVSELAQAIGFDQLEDELVFGSIWGRKGLSLDDRMICTLASLVALDRRVEIERYLPAALKIGLAPNAILETIAQSSFYSGLSAAETTMEIAQGAFSKAGVEVESFAPAQMTLEDLDQRGAELQARLHADQSAQGYAAPDDPVTSPLYSLASRFGYGDLWLRPGLEVRERMLCALAAFTVLRLDSQVRKFTPAAVRIGLSAEEVVEAVMQTAPYGGFPVALNALSCVREVLPPS